MGVHYILFLFLLLSGCLSCSSFLVFLLFCSRVLLIDMVRGIRVFILFSSFPFCDMFFFFDFL
ncbi:hypothetical protein HOY82DRAFT_568689, partial [Tuber indicum]